MVAIIEKNAPEVFEITRHNGSQFKCSESYVRKYLHHTLGWSKCHATKAAQKLPTNYEDLLKEAWLREAYVIHDYNVPAALRVNTDKTQLVYQQGTSTTWNESGVKQVAIVGQEEKCAFTLVPSISASGNLLPMQAIFHGKTTSSCPNPQATQYANAKAYKYQMLPLKTATYWSTQATMETLVNTIIAPYFEETNQSLGLPPAQYSIWKIDCWSVHKSKEFRAWMKKAHPTIIIIYIPGGCTGLWQPLEVGVQRVLKLSMHRSAHNDIVNEVSTQILNGVENIKLDTTVGTLRNRSVGWVVNTIQDIGKKKLIMKVSTYPDP